MKKTKLTALLLTAALAIEAVIPGLSATVEAAALEATAIEFVQETESVAEEIEAVSTGDAIEEMETVAEESVTEESITAETAAEETATEENIAEETAAEETATEETAPEETLTQEIAEEATEEVPEDVVETVTAADVTMSEQEEQAWLNKIFAEQGLNAYEMELCNMDASVDSNGNEAGILETDPTTTIKQRVKYNYFFNGTEASAAFTYAVAANSKVSVYAVNSPYFTVWANISDNQNGTTKGSFMIMPASVEMANAFYKLDEKAKKEACKITLKFEPYSGKSWTKDIQMTYCKTKAKVKLRTTSNTVYVYEENGTINRVSNRLWAEIVFNDNSKYYNSYITAAEILNPTDKKGNTIFENITFSKNSRFFDLDFVGNTGATAKLSIQCGTWIEPITFSYKVNVTKKLFTPKLATKTVTVNAYYGDEQNILMSIPKTGFSLLRVTEVEPVGKTDPGITIRGNGTYISVNAPKDVPTGSYKFRVTTKAIFLGNSECVLKPFVITVKVINKPITTKDVVVKKSKGTTISLGKYPKKSYIVVSSAALKNVSADLTAISFSSNDTSGAASKLDLSCEKYEREISAIIKPKAEQQPQKIKALLTFTYTTKATKEIISVDVPVTITIVK